MCFSIPYKINKISQNTALLEDGRSVKIDKGLKVRRGDYLQIAGDIAVGSLNKKEGLKIRQLIKNLNSYDNTN